MRYWPRISINSMEKTSAERSSSSRVMRSGTVCCRRVHHLMAGTSCSSEANELSCRMQRRLTSEISESNSPDAAEPYRTMLCRLVPAACLSRSTNSSTRLVEAMFVSSLPTAACSTAPRTAATETSETASTAKASAAPTSTAATVAAAATEYLRKQEPEQYSAKG